MLLGVAFVGDRCKRAFVPETVFVGLINLRVALVLERFEAYLLLLKAGDEGLEALRVGGLFDL